MQTNIAKVKTQKTKKRFPQSEFHAKINDSKEKQKKFQRFVKRAIIF